MDRDTQLDGTDPRSTRRRVLAGLAAGGCVAVAGCLGAGGGAESETESDGDDDHGRSPTAGDATTASPTTTTDGGADGTTPGKRLWAFDSDHELLGSPVFADGTVYSGSRANADGEKADLFAVDAATGDRRASFSLTRSVHSPAVTDGVAYVPAGEQVVALDLPSGTTRWSRTLTDLGEAIGAWVAGDLLVVFEWYEDLKRDELFGLARDSGETRWRYTFRRPITRPAVADGRVFAGKYGVDDAQAYAIDAATGEQLWATSLKQPAYGAGTPGVGGGTAVYPVISREGNDWFVAVDVDGGKRLWSVEAENQVLTPTAGDGTAFLPTGAFERAGTLDAVTLASGSAVWSKETAGAAIDPTLADGALYVGITVGPEGEGETVTALDPASGEPRWRADVPAPRRLQVGDGRLYCRLSRKRLVALSL